MNTAYTSFPLTCNAQGIATLFNLTCSYPELLTCLYLSQNYKDEFLTKSRQDPFIFSFGMLVFLLRGGVFASHDPNYSPENAVLTCISLVEDLKKKIYTDFFNVQFFFPLHFSSPVTSACYLQSKSTVKHILSSTAYIYCHVV